MASQHTHQQTEDEKGANLDIMISSLTTVQDVIEYIMQEVKSFQLETSISKDSQEGLTCVEAVKENQDNIAGARNNSSSSDSSLRRTDDEAQKNVSEELTQEATYKVVHYSETTNAPDKKEKNQHFTEKNEKTYDRLDPTNTSTANIALNGVQPIDTVKKVKENITNVQNKSSIMNDIEHFKKRLLENLELCKHHLESNLEQLQSDKTQLEERDIASKKESKDHMESVQIPMQICKPDPPNVIEMKSKCENKSSFMSIFSGLQRKKKVVSQLYCPISSDLVKSVTEELSAKLTKQMSTHGISLKMQICMSAQDLKKDAPLILICLQSSRLGTDVSNAIKGIKTGPNVAVLILHHADIHALPYQSSRMILTAPEYKQIGTILDMGFLSQKGLYECDMNRKSLEDIALFIKTMSGTQ